MDDRAKAKEMQKYILRGTRTATEGMVAANDTQALRSLAVVLRDFLEAIYPKSPNLN